MKLSLRLCWPLLALPPLVRFAQPKVVLAQPKKVTPAAPKTGEVKISNGEGGTTTFVDDAQGIARFTKNVVITQHGENLVVYAQEALYNRARNQGNASGQLRVVTRDSTIRGQKLYADFNERRFTIVGGVVITSYGNNDGAAAGLRAEGTKTPVRVLCDQVVWDYDTRQATATGNIQILQGNTRGTCNSIVYSEKENVIQLQDNVRFVNGKKHTFVARQLTFYIDAKTVAGGKSIVLFDPLENPDGTATTARPPKTPRVFGPAPTLPPDIVAQVAPPPSPPAQKPATTEEPIPLAEEPAEAPTAN